MQYYQIYLNHIAQTPNEKLKEDTQAFVNSSWENTHLLTKVQEEVSNGLNEYNELEVRKTTVSEYSINMFKNASDNRRLTFKDCEHNIERGRKYIFDNNYWITYDETIDENLYSQISIRRCNNELRWVNMSNGAIETEPCCIGEEYSSTSPIENKGIQIGNGKTILMVQGNDKTKQLNENQRFIISDIPYKLIAYSNYAQNDMVENKANLIWFYLQKDITHPSDDIPNGIANRYDYIYKINIAQDDFEQVNGYKGKLNADITLNDEVVKRGIEWVGNQYVNIDNNGEFVLNGSNGDIAEVTAYIKGNTEIYDKVYIKITDSIKQTKEIIVSPTYTETKQNDSVVFDVDLYVNNIKQNAPISYDVNIKNDKLYKLSQNGNTFTLTSLFVSKVPLVITFKHEDITKQIQISFKSAF